MNNNPMPHTLFRLALLLALTLGGRLAFAADNNPAGCDRACLYGFLDTYLEALISGRQGAVPVSGNFRFTENNVELKLGDGLWNTISGRGDYDLRVADTGSGQVGFFGIVEEHGIPAIIAMRMKVQDRRITEVETVLSRRLDNGPFPRPELLTLPSPLFFEDLPASARRPRARLISIADGYFDTLQLNDGQLFTYFHDDCNRRENGLQTTNNPEAFPGNPLTALGCEEQFKLGNFRYDDALRARRYPLVDEEKGLVMASAFIDHSGKLGDFTWTDGTPRRSSYTSPHTYVLLELFKIDDGKIRQVEAVFATVPYGMASPWPRD